MPRPYVFENFDSGKGAKSGKWTAAIDLPIGTRHVGRFASEAKARKALGDFIAQMKKLGIKGYEELTV